LGYVVELVEGKILGGLLGFDAFPEEFHFIVEGNYYNRVVL
jgi:hypothetical protein